MQTQADYSDRAWDMNTFQPYQQRLDEFNRGMAMNRQQQQQGVQTLMNAGTLLGGLAGGGGRNQRVGGQRDYANEGFSPYAQNDDVAKAKSNAWFQQHLANGTPTNTPNTYYDLSNKNLGKGMSVPNTNYNLSNKNLGTGMSIPNSNPYDLRLRGIGTGMSTQINNPNYPDPSYNPYIY